MVQRNSAQPLPLRILTHNIRYATSTPSKNELPWSERCPLILSQLRYHTRILDGLSASSNLASCFICLQEALHSQLQDILTGLNNLSPQGSSTLAAELPTGPAWAHIGVGREDGRKEGEYSPIIYPIQAFKLLDFQTRWLSPTPEQPSKGWDAGSTRILTVGVFEHRAIRRRLIACNTHLDNEGTVARKESIPIILETIKTMRQKWADADGEEPQFFLAGDFNSFPTQEAYLDTARSGVLGDIIDFVPLNQRYGNEVTFTGFVPDTDEDKDDIGRIDFIWLGPRKNVHGWEVAGYSVLPNVFDDGVFCSDHRCVVGDVTLFNK
ncbi:hypothetical protein EV356DRAFT_482941 [Viridothelium virens]|uniref:Endonuclease/exonuclease/phosphatase domain-containing protein n=1 Tax=Viridothelium virens TaxID=1048519 RepID=A0A6A6HER6_VIRVR|nr:hypothetical protein EV356DRAFT_482941 [Viridothelium virens]